ncbi:hypothetical protein [Microcoleus sp. FACHB-68]|nr:hypothetical protein [Microcoleus sp. FACHB-68]
MAPTVYLMFYPKPALAKALLDKSELLKQLWPVQGLPTARYAKAFLMKR